MMMHTCQLWVLAPTIRIGLKPMTCISKTMSSRWTRIGEGIVDVLKGRAGNYSNADDILLCNTWLQVSRDPSVGGDQSRDAYWGRMKEHFDAHNVSGIDRSERSLRSRWSTINSDCQKWAAAQKSVDKINPSGTNEDDRVSGISYMFIILVFGD